MHKSKIFEQVVGSEEAARMRAELAHERQMAARLRIAPKLSRSALNQVYLNVVAGSRSSLDERED